MSTKLHPLAQFELYQIHPSLHFQLFGLDLTITNSVAVMLLSLFTIFSCLVFFIGKQRGRLPTRIIAVFERLFLFIENMVADKVGLDLAKKNPFYVNLIFTLFIFILVLNLIGLMPFSFAPTSHITVTLTLAVIIFLVTLMIAIIRHGIFFPKIFVPHGTPLWMAPLIFVLEFFSYLAKPISLSVRLAANMIAGHVMLEVIGSFVIAMGIFGFLPFSFLIVINLFELFVAALQAYIFALLSAIYIGEALHH